MPVPTSLNDLSTTPASNYPAGSDSPSVLDDTLRAHAALMAQLRDRDSAFALTLLDDVDAAAARTTLGLADSGPYAGLRNLIINGNFAINQRAYVSGAATSGANQYTLDRWRLVTSGQNATFTASGNGNLVTAPAGGMEQVIEGLGIAGGTYVINWTGTATCTVGGTARTKGATFTLTANTNVTVRFSSGTVGEVQIEPGAVATPFEARPIGLELMLCYRYYQLLDTYMAGWTGSGVTNSYMTPFAVPMRATPTIGVGATTNTNTTGATVLAVGFGHFRHISTGVAAAGFISAATAAASAEL